MAIMKETLPKDLTSRGDVRKTTLKELNEFQALEVGKDETIKTHGHAEGQWEIWEDFLRNKAYVCLPGEEHTLINKGEKRVLKAYKGCVNYEYEDFVEFFKIFGTEVCHELTVIIE